MDDRGDEPPPLPDTASPLIETVEYDDAMAAFTVESVHASMCAIDPIYAKLRRSVLPEGVRRIRVQVDGAENISPEVLLSELSSSTAVT